MKYEAPEIPEGINTSDEHPLKEFVVLVGSLLLGLVVILALLTYFAQRMAVYIPFSVEQSVSEPIVAKLTQQAQPGDMDTYLQSLADSLAAQMDLPAEMKITVHYSPDNTVNAFATLGGHVVMFRGLLKKIPNENVLATVMAHEIAHIKHRHPVSALGRGMVLAVSLGVVSASLGSDIVENLIGEAGLMTALAFNRDQEAQADATALHALQAHYGHINGASELFQIFEREVGNTNQPPALWRSHPGNNDRIDQIQYLAQQNNWVQSGEVTALPDEFDGWLGKSANN